MAERVVNLSDWEARAWLAGATQLRRPVVPQLEPGLSIGCITIDGRPELDPEPILPRYAVGDVLLGRECWASAAENNQCHEADDYIIYRATDPEWSEELEGWRWRSSATMPRWAVRQRRRVTGVRVERIQDTSDKDAFACGLQAFVNSNRLKSGDGSARSALAALWDARHGARHPWASNPWVFVYSLEVVK